MAPSLFQVETLDEEAGLTQYDLAQRTGVGLRFVRDLEQGKTTLRMDKVNQVLALFGHAAGPVSGREESSAYKEQH